ncbi:MAG: SGNH/GDSL hydrolase family protein [Armatimonadetes bacterium]|jgi:lysophospholipase L1-like esterase|nr:SGNH/GDSL hydrolase family protein [Armatimonadota bacterium]
MLNWFAKIAAVSALLAVSLGANADCLLKSGDTMVFFGDSITEQRVYTRYVMNYFALRNPGVKIVFRNAGWVSDTAVGGNRRLQRDVLDLKPNLVSICYGMNDAGVTAYDQKIYDRYINAITELVDTLQEKRIKVVLLTAGCVDESKAARLKGYNDTLGKFAAQLCEFAKQRNIACYNIHDPMLRTLDAAKTADSEFVMMNDGVHPQPNGHMVMAYGLIKALGCESQASQLTIDVKSNKVNAQRCRISKLRVGVDSVYFTREDAALPIYLDDSAIAAVKYFTAFNEINNYLFKVTGLAAGKWKLTVTGGRLGDFNAGTYDADELAAGVNLAYAPGPWKKLAGEVNNLSREQESVYYSRWRQVQLANIPSAANAEKQALLDKLDSITDQREIDRINRAAWSRVWQWSLRRVR